MFEPVQPAPAQPPAVSGLVRSAVTPNDGERWQNGMAWRSEHCPQARTFDPCGGLDSFEEPPVGVGDDGIVYYRPPAFRVEDECWTRGSDDAARVPRVRRQALAVTSYMVARELHGGAHSLANPYVTPDSGGVADQVNHYLAEPTGTVVPGGPVEPLNAIGLLEEAARDAMLGMDPFIHVPVSMVPFLHWALRRDGQMLFTKTGATVVADAGYPGTGPTQAGTSEVQTVTVTGAPTGGTFTLTFDGETTSAIPFDATPTAVQDALNALSNLDGVAVTGGAGGPYTVTFPDSMGDVPQMTGDGSGLTGGTTPAVDVVTTTPGVAPAPAAGEWMYATGPVQVRLDEVYTQRLIDHRENRILYVADRLFAATFDPCTLHGIEVDRPPAGP